MDGSFERKFLPFKDKIMFKSYLIKSNHRVLIKTSSTGFEHGYSSNVKQCLHWRRLSDNTGNSNSHYLLALATLGGVT